MTREPWNIQLFPVRREPLAIEGFKSLPKIPIIKVDEPLSEIIDPPITLSAQEERLWRSVEVDDRSKHLYVLGAILKKHNLRDDLIVESLAKHPLSIDKYLGRTMREATRIVRKLEATPEDVPIIQNMLVWDWFSFMSRPAQLSWMIEDAWIDKSVGFVSGRAKSYKSWTVADLALSVASGMKFLNNFDTVARGPVVIIQEEDPHAVIQERLNLIMNSKGIGVRSKVTPFGLEVSLPGFPILIMNLQGFRLDDEEKIKQLEQILGSINPALLVMDPLINMLPVGLSDNDGIRTASVLQRVKLWREEYQCSIVIAHHWNKGDSRASTVGADRIYGSFAFHAWLESALHVRPAIEEGEVINSVVVERELKAMGGSGETFKVEFDINTKGEYTSHHYTPKFMGNAGPKEDAYTLIRKNPEISFKELQRRTGTPTRTLTRHLEKMAQDGLVSIVYSGEGKKMETYYTAIDSDKPNAKKRRVVARKEEVVPNIDKEKAEAI